MGQNTPGMGSRNVNKVMAPHTLRNAQTSALDGGKRYEQALRLG